ncbi:polymorphic toxin type 44 domain-containing protein [Sporolactobacillus sp. CQH2019]|uniref:polymorphic toxin type 44 domain-containing protein n=1 Tax=Sporolactobacillus sp. CQH2019 TaxID=3023512 RepID=UPI0023676B9C|nr:polymorphic toxin type 44 domain-containing protein [Sporolactobacillus sp. CQH2019]MDD9150920.1 polymorphic toxin type 44 domain-containing protein [Sporolactobacillus sp. CQH2019]
MKKRFLEILVVFSLAFIAFFVGNQNYASAARYHGDYTNRFRSILHSNANQMSYYVVGGYFLAGMRGTGDLIFAENERQGGKWDYKRKYGYYDKYRFRGKIITGDDFGNIHYGYVGKAAGFSDRTLETYGGIVQVIGNKRINKAWYRTYYDEPKDNTMIRYGIWLYNHGF